MANPIGLAYLYNNFATNSGKLFLFYFLFNCYHPTIYKLTFRAIYTCIETIQKLCAYCFDFLLHTFQFFTVQWFFFLTTDKLIIFHYHLQVKLLLLLLLFIYNDNSALIYVRTYKRKYNLCANIKVFNYIFKKKRKINDD